VEDRYWLDQRKKDRGRDPYKGDLVEWIQCELCDKWRQGPATAIREASKFPHPGQRKDKRVKALRRYSFL
jgi:hypothetical protein